MLVFRGVRSLFIVQLLKSSNCTWVLQGPLSPRHLLVDGHVWPRTDGGLDVFLGVKVHHADLGNLS